MANETAFIFTAVDKTFAAIESAQKGLSSLAGHAVSVDAAFQRLTGIGSILTGLTAGLTAASVIEFVRGVADSADAMNDLSERTGYTVEQLSKYQYAAKLSDMSNEELEAGLNKLNKSIGENGTAFGRIGVELKDSAGNIKDNSTVLEEVADKFSTMKDGAEKAALAQEIFGKSGTKLIPFLNQGKDGLKAMGDEAQRLGIVLSSDTAAKSAILNDSLDKLGSIFEGIKISVGSTLIPLLSSLASEFVAVGGTAESASSEVRGMANSETILRWAQSAASAAAFVIDGFKGVSVVIQGVAITISAAAAQMAAAISGNFAGVKAIGDQWTADMEKLFTFDSAQVRVDEFFDRFQRTANINGKQVVYATREQAIEAQAAADKIAAAQKQALQTTTTITEEQLKLQKQIKDRYADAEAQRVMGDTRFMVSKVEERYQKELDAIKGLSNESELRADIMTRKQAEIDAVYNKSASYRASLESILTDNTKTEAEKRVAIERAAAGQVLSSWERANSARAGSSGQGYVDSNGNLAFELGATMSWSDFINEGKPVAGFATGGSFMVGGSGGTDSQLVQFRASPDERVTIETPDQQRAGKGDVTINVNVNGGDPNNIISAIRQALRTNPGLFSTGMTRAG